MPDATPAPAAEPANKRFRSVEVRRVERVTPKAVRITLGGDALEGFGTPLLGGHIKVMLPGTDQVRAYTPRRFDAARREIEIDVILHGDSPGSRWATAAKPGDPIDVRGPGGRGHTVDPAAAWHLLAGDACAVPAIGMVLESLPASTRAIVILEVDNTAEERPLPSPAQVQTWWVRAGEVPGEALETAVRSIDLPEGAGQVFLACESGIMRRIRQHLIGERGLPSTSMHTRGYWKAGIVNYPDHDYGQDD
jgi:NADPH-dependent ferric siderophore reductase